jgi:hypothetical protein
MDIQVPRADVTEYDQATAPGKERERDPIIGGDIANISNGVTDDRREYGHYR